MIGDVFVIAQPENYRFDQDPRSIAFKAEDYMKSTGIADEMRIRSGIWISCLWSDYLWGQPTGRFYYWRGAGNME